MKVDIIGEPVYRAEFTQQEAADLLRLLGGLTTQQHQEAFKEGCLRSGGSKTITQFEDTLNRIFVCFDERW